MRKKKFDRWRFWVAIAVTSVAWIIGLTQIFGRQGWLLVQDTYWVPMQPEPLPVMIITTIMILVTLYMWRWYRMDRVQRALSNLNETERGELIQRLAQSMKPELINLATSDRLTLNDDGELEESVVSQKRKNSQHG